MKEDSMASDLELSPNPAVSATQSRSEADLHPYLGGRAIEFKATTKQDSEAFNSMTLSGLVILTVYCLHLLLVQDLLPFLHILDLRV